MGRWEKGKVASAKYAHCSIRNSRYSLVSAPPRNRPPKDQPAWQLFDLQNDPGQQNDISATNPEVVKELSAAYDAWWTSIQPDLCNEDAEVPAVNPFKALYWEQFPDERPKTSAS